MTRKYRNVPTEVDGIRFASKAEARRYSELKLLQRAGEISDLTCQPAYNLVVNGHKICRYTADFSYLTKAGEPVTEDVKGTIARDFPVKRKLFRALLGREIVVIGRAA